MNKFTSFRAPLMQAYLSTKKHPDVGVKLFLMNQTSPCLTGSARNNIWKLHCCLRKWWMDGAISAPRNPTIHAEQESMLL